MRKRQILRPRSTRHPIRIPCQVVRMRDFRLVADSIEDLSLGGVLVGPADPILTGERLFLSFRLPHSGRWIDTDATVARVVHGRRPGDRTRQLGVQFDGLDASLVHAIHGQIGRIPALPPGTRPGRRDAAVAMRSLSLGSGWVRSLRGHALIRWFER